MSLTGVAPVDFSTAFQFLSGFRIDSQTAALSVQNRPAVRIPMDLGTTVVDEAIDLAVDLNRNPTTRDRIERVNGLRIERNGGVNLKSITANVRVRKGRDDSPHQTRIELESGGRVGTQPANFVRLKVHEIDLSSAHASLPALADVDPREFAFHQSQIELVRSAQGRYQVTVLGAELLLRGENEKNLSASFAHPFFLLRGIGKALGSDLNEAGIWSLGIQGFYPTGQIHNLEFDSAKKLKLADLDSELFTAFTRDLEARRFVGINSVFVEFVLPNGGMLMVDLTHGVSDKDESRFSSVALRLSGASLDASTQIGRGFQGWFGSIERPVVESPKARRERLGQG